MALCTETDDCARFSDVAKFIIDQIPQEKLTTYARLNPAFRKGGFRLDNLKAIRSQLARMIEGKEVIDVSLRKLLADHSQCARVLTLLSSSVILGHRKELEVLFGEEHLLFAAMLDDREEIRKEAADWIGNHDGAGETGPEDDESRTWALERMNDLLWPLCNSFAMAEKEGQAPSGGDDFALTKELKELRQKTKKLVSVEKQLDEEKRKRKEAIERADRLQSEAQEATRVAGSLKQRCERAEAALARNKKDAERQAEAIIQTRLANEFSGWLGGSRLEQIKLAFPSEIFPSEEEPTTGAAGEKDFEALVERTRKALTNQAKADAISGVRSVLERRLTILENLLGSCERSLANAMRPMEELLEIKRELRTRCDHLREILSGRQDEEEKLRTTLSVSINTSADRQLPEWKHIADKLFSIGLLTEEGHGELVEAVHRRYAALHLQGSRELREEDLTDQRSVLRLGLQGRLGVVLLIDGHNMLYALQSRYVRPQDHKGPPSEARQWLTDDVIQMVSQSPACRVILAFDGPERSDAVVAPNVKLIYSGGTGEHRADRVLVDEARFIVQNGEKVRLILVTNDRELAENAAKLGVGNLAPLDLLEHFA